MDKLEHDITFIGAGIATSFCLIKIIEELLIRKPDSPLKICVIDKYPDFFTGIPYGERSGKSVLLINSIENFLPDPVYRRSFVTWLIKHKEELIEEFGSHGGIKAKKWIKDNLPQTNSATWDKLYVPRFFFGRYIRETVQERVAQVEKEGYGTVVTYCGEAIDVEKINGKFLIKLMGGNTISSEKLVLSVGSLPSRKIEYPKNVLNSKEIVIINDIYSRNLHSNLVQIKNLINNTDYRLNVLVIGANASGLETLYKLNDDYEINEKISSYTVLSTYGIMPDSDIDYMRQKSFMPNSLHRLKNQENVSAEDIAKAAFEDLNYSKKIGLGAASTVEPISSAVGELLPMLELNELKLFACKYGNEIGRMQRCAGSHYTSVIKKLKSSGKLEHIAGRFKNIVFNSDRNELELVYLETSTGNEIKLNKNFQIIVNCMGSTNLKNSDIPAFLQRLISKKLLTPNDSHIGFDVNEKFLSSENLYIAGPLLAGNVIENRALWHLEHCGRIIWSSNLLAKSMIDQVYQLSN